MQRSSPVVLFLLSACTGTSVDPETPTAVDLAGSATWEAHLERPHATRTWPVELHLQCASSAARCELRSRLPGQRAPDVASYLRTADGACWVRESGSAAFIRDQGAGARLLEVLLAATVPGERDHAIAWQHPRLGEVLDQATWVGSGEGRSLHVVWHRASDQAELVLQRLPGRAPAEADLTFTVEAGAAAQPAPVGPPTFRTIAPFVHEITLPDVDTRSLAVEFADHLVLCETSLDNEAGERLLAVLDEHLPGKPVRYVLFGHYHPHYTGGLRPVMARGATVVAPPLGAAYAREIAARPFRSPPDALARSGRQPVIEPFVDQRMFRDASNELIAIDIGVDSHHTDEYVVFWLPRQQLLFEGDLGWFPGPSGPRGGGIRARGLVHAIEIRQLPVVTLVQAWPTSGASALPLSELRSLLGQ